MSDATTEVKDPATDATPAVEASATSTEDTTSFTERYSEVLGKVNDTLDQVDWNQMGRIGKIVGIFAAVIVAQILIKGHPRHDQSAARGARPAGAARRCGGGPVELEKPHHQRQAQCTRATGAVPASGIPRLSS
jgi:hypothetical protein